MKDSDWRKGKMQILVGKNKMVGYGQLLTLQKSWSLDHRMVARTMNIHHEHCGTCTV